MTAYVLRRIGILALSLAVALVVVFALLRVLPGDPANALLAANATPDQVAAARREVGSDLPLAQQFAQWFGQMLHLDLGTSFTSGLPVLPDLAQRLVVTVPLTLIAFVLATVLACVVGFVAAARSDRWYGVLLSGITQLGIAVPVFWIGILLVQVVSLQWGLLPSSGFPRDDWTYPGDALESLALPVTTVALVMTASIARYVRSAVLDVLGADHIRTARALGASTASAFLRHGVRSAVVPVIAVLGIELASTFLGAVVVESVFALPGLGSMLITGIEQHDYPSIQGVLLVSTVAVLVIGFVADVVQRIVDPRLRSSVSGNR
ncbi:ABC transporter permease [Curtobacterium sp. MCSS17_008]|uniref:ABC transporter permease n=1 Tax=Curtobacterium sp. MCSS17_008 TaxID=2175647 RepID=UPI000DA85BFE|nr:ABC transporter permease [Curtobacterium sp. MCSS17_008]PZF56690.1 ABC transporter permease [Curtobacterium sp. MCSS17_008]